jgi:NTP pyrophosphatase (non-canonical NTP hydrolase)
MYERLYNEFEELEATVQRGKYQNIPNELADCLIVMYSLASILKIDLMHEVDKKMNINRRRKWKLHGDGTGQHID